MRRLPLPATIETQRLIQRPHRLEDVDDVLAYASDEEWARFLAVPHPYERTDALEFLARMVHLDHTTHPAWALVVDDRAVGGINVRFAFEHRLGEMGWSIARPFWGLGLTTEAVRAVVDISFNTYGDLNRIRAAADARNAAFHRVMKNVGMRWEGTLRHNRVVRES